MTNYEHIFESAMSYRKQGKSFREFENDIYEKLVYRKGGLNANKI